jgi:hypothetical protein
MSRPTTALVCTARRHPRACRAERRRRRRHRPLADRQRRCGQLLLAHRALTIGKPRSSSTGATPSPSRLPAPIAARSSGDRAALAKCRAGAIRTRPHSAARALALVQPNLRLCTPARRLEPPPRTGSGRSRQETAAAGARDDRSDEGEARIAKASAWGLGGTTMRRRAAPASNDPLPVTASEAVDARRSSATSRRLMSRPALPPQRSYTSIPGATLTMRATKVDLSRRVERPRASGDCPRRCAGAATASQPTPAWTESCFARDPTAA